MSSLAPSPYGPERPFDVTGPVRAPGHLVTEFAGRPTGDLVRQLSALVSTWWARHEQRRHLARLDDHLLRDIGLDRATAWREIGKPFWRP